MGQQRGLTAYDPFAQSPEIVEQPTNATYIDGLAKKTKQSHRIPPPKTALKGNKSGRATFYRVPANE